MAEFEMMAPADISNEKVTIEFLILRQIDRTNYLATMSRANKTSKIEIRNLLYSIKSGQRRIQSMLWPYLENDEEYNDTLKEINEKLDSKTGAIRDVDFGFDGQENFMNALDDWNDLLMLKLRTVGLFPRRKKGFDFPSSEDEPEV